MKGAEPFIGPPILSVDTCYSTYYSMAIKQGGGNVSSEEIIKVIRSDGWYEVAQRGSYKQFLHPTKPGKVTIPSNKKDLPKGTENSILKQAGLK